MSEQDQITGSAFEWPLMKRMLSYTKPYKSLFAAALSFTILLSLLMPVRPYLFQLLIDQEVASGDVGGVRTMILMIVGVLILQTFISYLNTYLTSWLGQSVMRDMRTQVFDHILSLRLQYYDKTPIGRLQTRTISDVETLNNVFSSGLVRILGDLLQLFAIFAVMLYTSWQLTLVVLITLPLLLFATYIFKNKIKSAFQGVRQYVSEVNSFLQEHLTGMMIIHIFNREKVEYKKFQAINKNLRGAHLRSVLYFSVFFPVVELISAFGMALIVWYGAGSVLEGKISFGILVAFIMYLQMFYRPIRMLADQFNTLQLGMVSAARIFHVLDTDEFIPNEGEQDEMKDKKEMEIAFQDVTFAYNEPEWVLKNINLDIQPGEKVALVGSTGSGKSTIINLLSRFYEIQKGQILLNGKDIRDYKLSLLRSMIGVVLQDVFLFSGTIYENITLNNDSIPLEDVKEAAKRVGAHDFIMKLPNQYQHKVQERGATLSLGQRQLIAFARVMVYDPRVLVLDEATANIDTESEEIIQQAVETVMADRTSIIIAHRLSTIQKADKIVVLEKGNIIEMGNHHELMEEEGAYFELHQQQFVTE